MWSTRTMPWLLLGGLLLGCGDKDDSSADEDEDDEGPQTTQTDPSQTTPSTLPTDTGDTATGSSTTTNGMPPNPSPLELTLSGVVEDTLSFDSPTCTYPFNSQNFRVFWRTSDGSHSYVLIAELLGTFPGKPGSFNETDHSARVKLQEEAGGGGNYFTTEDGDTVTITVEYLDKKVAWGEFSFSSMQGEGGTVSLDPQPIPIWCPSLN